MSGYESRVLELPTCVQYQISPCKIIMAHPEAPEAILIENSRNDRPICTCAGEASCPHVWGEDPERTISFYIKLSGRQTSVQYKFCEQVVEERSCTDNEIVASLGGTGLLPVELEAKNCRCNTSEPLHLAKTVVSGFRRRHDFVCSMPTCDVNRSEPHQCMTLNRAKNSRSESWEYSCECPEDFRCTVDPDDLRNSSGNEPISGYCRRL
ncbi:uncharacterized protein LOC135480589 [Liolophura sinensis]|uniref:uncharacterized protein LOC135480589 n=1 Tax=Liolophura sinensis TaxID=3198878 RepID=UPI003158FDEE